MPFTSAAGAQVGEVGADWFTVYLIPETLRATGLGGKGEGATVNLEIEAQTQVRNAHSVLLSGVYRCATQVINHLPCIQALQCHATKMNVLRCVKRPQWQRDNYGP